MSAPLENKQRRPLVALATSRDWPTLAPDDQVIAPALNRAGVDVEIAIWTDAVDWQRFDLIVVRSCWDYHHDLPRWLGWIAALESGGLGPRLCNAPAVLRWNAEKTYLARLQERGVPVIPTLWLDEVALASPEALVSALAASRWDSLVCKPAVSAGALGTFRCVPSQTEATHAAVVAAWPELVRRAPLLVQPFLSEIVVDGEWSLLFFGGHFSHGVLKRPAPGDFRVQERHGGSTTALQPGAALVAAANVALTAAAREIGAPGPQALLYARVDLVNTAAGPLLVELELSEPALFLGNAAGGTATAPVDVFASAIRARITR